MPGSREAKGTGDCRANEFEVLPFYISPPVSGARGSAVLSDFPLSYLLRGTVPGTISFSSLFFPPTTSFLSAIFCHISLPFFLLSSSRSRFRSFHQKSRIDAFRDPIFVLGDRANSPGASAINRSDSRITIRSPSI